MTKFSCLNNVDSLFDTETEIKCLGITRVSDKISKCIFAGACFS